MITTFSLGMLYSLSAFPRIRSDSPLEYTLAVSKVLMPFSYLWVKEKFVSSESNGTSGTWNPRELDMFESRLLA